MNKQTLNQIIELSQECLTRFWHGDLDFVTKHFDKDVIWIGSVQSQFTEGIADTVTNFKDIIKELQPCHLLRQEFYIAQNLGNACTVVGKYLTTTDETADYFLQVQQRCTFVWEIVNGTPIIKHLHVSNPMGELKLAEGETFPNALGYMASRYFVQHLNSAMDKRRLIITDRKERTHFLTPGEIVYAVADKKNCIIHTLTGGTICARMSIAEFLNIAAIGFYSVHRSYVVNINYVTRIQPYEIIMANGSAIPVPVKKYTEIREVLTNHGDNK